MSSPALAVLFDLDGTLSDSGSAVEEGWRRWAEERDMDTGPLWPLIHGRRTAEVIARFAPDLDAQAEAERLEASLAEMPERMSRIDPTCELYASLGAQQRAIVTSATRVGAMRRLEMMGLEPGVLVCAEDVGSGKPQPECYLLAAMRLDLAPDRCVVVEDAPVGISAGREAGMTVIALETTHARYELGEADYVIEPPELPNLAARLLEVGVQG